MSKKKINKQKEKEIARRNQIILESYEQTGSLRRTAADTGIDRDMVRKIVQASSKKIIDPETGADLSNVRNARRFVVTSALNNCPLNKPFVDSLRNYCSINDAQLLVIPVRYRNVSLYTGNYEPYWPKELDDCYVSEDIELSSNISIMGSMRIQATASRPLRGSAGIAKGKSAIFGHPRVALETLATPLSKYPLVYFTTGSVSKPNYSETRAGRLGEFHHSFSAAIVETDGDKFWWRHVHADEEGCFIDIDKKYCPDSVSEAPRAAALVPGDIHVDFADGDVLQALFNDLEDEIKPRNVLLHDVLDMFSGSHHHVNNKVLQVMKEASGRNSVYDELSRCADFFKDIYRPDTNYYVVRSNHHDHLDKWLNNNSSHIDAKNLYLWHKLNADQMREALKIVEYGISNDWSVTSAFELAMREFLEQEEINEQLHFHDDRKELSIMGIDCGNHGDRGPNGSRGSRASFSRVQRRTIIGHSHSPGIHDGCYQVGHSTISELPYTAGYSSWLTCAAIIYADGNRTLLPIIDGQYRLQGGDNMSKKKKKKGYK